MVTPTPTNKEVFGKALSYYKTNPNAPGGSFNVNNPTAVAGTNLGNTTGATSPGSTIVADSGSVVANENTIKNTVAGLSAPDPNTAAVQAASDAYVKLLNDQSKIQLEQQRADQIKGINAGFDQAKTDAQGQQTKEVGTTSVALQRIGGYLGGSASAVGALNNLSQTHRQELAALEVKRTSAIQTANQAINDKQFALAEAAAKEAKTVASDIADRRDKFFSQSMALVQEQRQQETLTTEQINKKRDDARASLSLIVDKFGGIDINSLDKETQMTVIGLADTAKVPLSLLQGDTTAQSSQKDTQKQRQITNAVAIAGLKLREKNYNKSLQITASDATKLGLPRSLVGTSEVQLQNELQQDLPPTWFFEYKTNSGDFTNKTTQTEANKEWKDFKNEVVKTNPLIDFGSAGLPPPIE